MQSWYFGTCVSENCTASAHHEVMPSQKLTNKLFKFEKMKFKTLETSRGCNTRLGLAFSGIWYFLRVTRRLIECCLLPHINIYLLFSHSFIVPTLWTVRKGSPFIHDSPREFHNKLLITSAENDTCIALSAERNSFRRNHQLLSCLQNGR